MHTAWLLPTALLSTSVHAFYPVHSRKPSDDNTQAKRFFPVAPENAEIQGSGPMTLDVRKLATPVCETLPSYPYCSVLTMVVETSQHLLGRNGDKA